MPLSQRALIVGAPTAAAEVGRAVLIQSKDDFSIRGLPSQRGNGAASVVTSP
jgi:hypothetical protein